MVTQARVVPALAWVHNFIRIHDPDDDPWTDEDEQVLRANAYAETTGPAMGQTGFEPTDAEAAAANARRDTIARAMWKDFEALRRHRGQPIDC